MILITLLFWTFSVAAQDSFSIEDSDFRLVNSEGQSRALGYYTDYDQVTLVAWPGGCADADKIIHDVEALAKKESRTKFLWINPHYPQDRSEVNRRAHQVEVLMDRAQLVSRGFKFTSGGDFLTLSTHPWSEVKRGNFAESGTCKISYVDRPQQKWNREFAQMFFRNCVTCHAQVPSVDMFRKDDDVLSWWAMNRNVMRMQRMPFFGNDYDSSVTNCSGGLGFRLRESDLVAIETWLNSPRPQKLGTNYFKEFRETLDKKRATAYPPLGKPDLEWSMAEADLIPASGKFYYRYVQIAGPLKEDVQIKAYTYTGNLDAAHHVHLYSLPKPLAEFDLTKSTPLAPYFLFGTHQQQGGERFGDIGWILRKGSYVALQFHYQPTGREERNQARVQVYLNKSKTPIVSNEVTTLPWGRFVVPAGAKNFRYSYQWTAPKDMTLLAVTHHAHSRSKFFEFKMREPGNEEKPVCRISYMASYNHQGTESLIDALPVKKGTVFTATYIYDNSAENSENPLPIHDVKEGMATENEMAFTNIRFVSEPFERRSKCWDEPLGCVFGSMGKSKE